MSEHCRYPASDVMVLLNRVDPKGPPLSKIRDLLFYSASKD